MVLEEYDIKMNVQKSQYFNYIIFNYLMNMLDYSSPPPPLLRNEIYVCREYHYLQIVKTSNKS